MRARSRGSGAALLGLSLLIGANLASADGDRVSKGQRLYVPVYSEIPVGSGRSTFKLAATLIVRNLDARSPISVRRIDYYDSKGELLESQLSEPAAIGPLASLERIVKESERRGGAGAGYLVEWTAEAAVQPPHVQTIMVTTAGLQGIAFTADAVVLEELGQ